MKKKELWKALEDFYFLAVLSNSFMEEKRICFRSAKEVQDFLTKFLLLECISGSNSDEDLMRAYEIVRRWVSEEKTISSEELPIGRHKTHADKNLTNVMYHICGAECWYEDS